MKKSTINMKTMYTQKIDIFCFCITVIFFIIRISIKDISPRIVDLIYVTHGACYLERRLKRSKKIDCIFIFNFLFLSLLRILSLYIVAIGKNYGKIVVVVVCSMLYVFLLLIRKRRNKELERKFVNLSYVWLWVLIPNLVSF